MDLLWVAHEYKMMVVGSTSMRLLYFYSFYFHRINFDSAALYSSAWFNLNLSNMPFFNAHVENQLQERYEDSFPELIALEFTPR